MKSRSAEIEFVFVVRAKVPQPFGKFFYKKQLYFLCHLDFVFAPLFWVQNYLKKTALHVMQMNKMSFFVVVIVLGVFFLHEMGNISKEASFF